MQQFKLIFLLSLALCVFSGIFAEDLIAKTCQSTPDSRICESSLRSDPRSSTADTKGLILIMIDVVKSKFTDSITIVNKIIKESPPPSKEKALKECVRLFQDAINIDVPEAKSAVELGDPKFGVDGMRGAEGEASDCEEAVTSSGGESALIERTKFLSVLSDVASSMINLLL